MILKIENILYFQREKRAILNGFLCMQAPLTIPIVSLTSSLDYSLFTYADLKEMKMWSIFKPRDDANPTVCIGDLDYLLDFKVGLKA